MTFTSPLGGIQHLVRQKRVWKLLGYSLFLLRLVTSSAYSLICFLLLPTSTPSLIKRCV